MQQSSGSALYILVLIVISDFFESGVFNPFSIYGMLEASLVIYTLSACAYVVKFRRLAIFELLIIAIPPIMALHSAIMANVTFGQPLIYGLIEERRAFQLYSYFPLALLLRTRNTDADTFFKLVAYISAAISVLALLYRFSIIPGFQTIEYSLVTLRNQRANISSSFVLIGLFVSVSYTILASSKAERNRSIVCAGIILAYMLLANQTRQVIAGASIAMLITYIWSQGLLRLTGKLPLIAVGITLSAVALVTTVQSTDIGMRYLVLFNQLASDDYIEGSSRSLAFRTATSNLSIHGNGALSGLYNDGFHSVYGEFFFLSDLGILGTAYRYGALSLIYILVTFYFLKKALSFSRIRLNRRTRVALFMTTTLLVVLWPLGGILEYKSAVLGLCLAGSRWSLRHHNKPWIHHPVKSTPWGKDRLVKRQLDSPAR